MKQTGSFSVVHTIGSIAEHTGGPARTATSLCSSIGELGGAVALVSGTDPSTDKRLILPDRSKVDVHLVEVFQVGPVRLYPRYTNTLNKVLDTQKHKALIHDHGIWLPTNLAARRVARNRSLPYVVHPRGMLEPWTLEYKSRKKKFAWVLYQRRIIASAAAVVATSEQECENVKRLFPELPVAIIPNGVDMPDTAEMLSPKSRVDGRRTVLFMSRIHPKKNLTGLLHAWHLLPRPVSAGWRLLIAGPDEAGHGQEIASLVWELGLQDSVELIGSVKRTAKLQSSCLWMSLYCLHSRKTSGW